MFSCVGGWVLCCAWVVVPLPVGLVLFVGVLVGDVHRFVVCRIGSQEFETIL